MTQALLQVFLIVLIGGLVAAIKWVDAAMATSFSNLILRVFMPALLFRAMAGVDLEVLSFSPVVAYLGSALLVFALVYLLALRARPVGGRESPKVRAAAMALCSSFSNNVMVGIPVISLFFGQEGLAVLLTVITLHAFVLLGAGVLGFELAGSSGAAWHQTLRQAAMRSLLNPVVIPVLLGLAYNFSGLPLPLLIDSTLAVMGQVAIPACLLLLGASVYHARTQFDPKGVGPILLAKLVLLPIVVWTVSSQVFELSTLQVAVLTTMASLPTGANPYLLAQRHGMGVSLSATAVAATTALTAFTLPYVLSMFAQSP